MNDLNDAMKFAMIALPRVPFDWNNVPAEMELGMGFGYSQKLPFPLESHWKEWIGSTRADLVTHAGLIIFVRANTSAPDSYDAENATLNKLVDRFYQGLLLATSLWIDAEPVRLSGSIVGGTANLRQVSTLLRVGGIHDGANSLIVLPDIQRAAALAPVLNSFPKGKYQRLCRILNAYFEGIKQNDLRERLHQFTRCIEGLIFADPGQTTSQFKSRTELFVGPRDHEYMGSLYANRSAAEHMNDPIVDGNSEREKHRNFWELVIVSEEIARYCILNVLLKKEVLNCYEDSETMAAFWNLQRSEREVIWGVPISIAKVRKSINQTHYYRDMRD